MSEAIQEKIKKLLRLAADQGASENEAAVAMKMAQKLMLEHGIKSADLDEEPKGKWGESNKAFDDVWHGWLATGVGYMFCVRPLVTTTSSGRGICFVGRSDQVDTAEMMMAFLSQQVEAMYKIFLPKGLTVSARAQYRTNFKRACAARLSTRLKDIAEMAMKSDAMALEYAGSTALVVLSHREQLKSEADDLVAGKVRAPRKSKGIRLRGDGAVAGRVAGDQIRINESVR